MNEQPKHAKDMTPEERAAALAELKRAPVPEPMPTEKHAAEMTKRERAEWLAEHRKRYG